MLFSNSANSQSLDCDDPEPICTDTGFTFTSNENGPDVFDTDLGNNYGCLGSGPNPSWYYLEIEDDGDIDMSLTAPSDIDYIIWGPYADLDQATGYCGTLGANPNPNPNTVTGAFASFTFEACDGDAIDVFYTSGGGFWENEISFSISAGPTLVYNSGTEPDEGLNTSLTATCNPAGSCCTYTVDMVDSYGDGWDGSMVGIQVNGVSVLEEIGNNIIDCSYSPTNLETPSILNAQNGEVYIMLVTNYANISQELTLSQTSGAGSTNCDILCDINLDFTVGACDPVTNSYSISGNLEVDGFPLTGTLTIEDCNGNQITYNAPFNTTYNFALNGLSPDGQACSLSASFSDDLCVVDANFTAPSPCCEEPSYAVNEISCFDECDGQIVIEGNGAAPFDYSLENSTDNSVIASITNSSTEQTFSNLCGGQYTIYVTDVEDCTTEVSFQLDNPEDLTILTEELIGCESVDYNGNTYFASQTVVDSFLSVNGCDSIVTAEITVLPSIPDTVNDIELCQGQIHIEGPETYFTDGTYSYTYTTSNFCDSTVVTNVTLIPLIEYTEFVTTCIGSTYTVAGNTYWTGGTFTNLLQTADGCDSLLTTVLDFNEIVTEQDINLCFGLVHNENGEFYTESGTYSYTYLNATASGCDSTVITHLTIVEPTATSVNVVGCFGTPYIFNGNPISTNGVHTDVFDSQYCTQDSTVTLNIFFAFPQTTTINIDLCDGETIDIEGITYDNSTQVTNMYTNMFGCDSIVTTAITVAPVVTNALTESICNGESIDINGATYSTAQDVIDTYTSAAGCDSTVTITIVVNPLVTFDESVTICEGETATVNGTDYTTAQDVVNVYPSILGCDSTVTTTIAVIPVVTNALNESICDGTSITINGNVYSTAQDVVDTFTSAAGCDSVVTTTLTVNPLLEVTNTVEICEGDAYSEGTSVYSASGVFIDVYASAAGCDSTVTTVLNVNPVYDLTNTSSICLGGSYFEGTSEYTEEGVYTDAYTTVSGCDSIITTILSVDSQYEVTNNINICAGDIYTEGSSTYDATGTYTDLYISTLGCDSIVTTVLSVGEIFESTVSVAMCEGETYIEGTSIYNTTGTYTDTYQTVLGCDSVIITELIVHPEYNTITDVSICDGDSYFEQASEYTATGTYTDLYASIEGCDSTVTTVLTVNPVFAITNSPTICEGGTYAEGTSDYTSAGTYTDLYSSVNGCDSVVTTILTVDTQFSVSVDVEICDGESHTEGASVYTVQGTYSDAYISTLGCDSVVTTILTVINCCIDQFTTNAISICDGDSYFEQASEYTAAGTYTDLYASVDGCDSTVTTVLTVNPVFAITNSPTICEGGTYVEGTSDYTAAGTYTDLYSSVNGCDSTITTILTVDTQFSVSVDVEICDGESHTEGASVYTVAGSYTDSYTSVLGCDSIVTTNLSILPIAQQTNNVSICEGGSYFEQTSEYTAAGSYTDVYQTVNGCDSIVTTILTIDSIISTVVNAEICEGDSYTEGTSVYTQAGTYDDTYISSLGCDSVVTTNLTVINCCIDQFTATDVSICDGDSYFEQISEYTIAGTYTDLYASVDGCDSTVTTTLSIIPLEFTTNNVSICEGASYFEGTSEYSITGSYNNIYVSVNGCDSTVTTILSIDQVITSTNIIELCDGESYTEGISTYDVTGIYTDSYISVQGCDSIVTTDLTINPNAQTLVTITLCEGETYTEGGNVYSVEGTYFDLYQTIDGCDSTVTTIVGVNEVHDFTNFVTITDGDVYFEGENEYTESGSYLDVYENIFVCDSSITTILTVNATYDVTNTLSICDGEIYLEGTSEYINSGTYLDLYTSVLGTDSIVTTILTVNPSPIITNTITICDGESYTDGSSIYDQTGTYTDVYTTILGCDSTVITELTVVDVLATTNDISLCAGESYSEGTSVYDETGTYTDLYTSALGCDSLVTTALVINEALISPNFIILCAGEIYDEGTSTYDISGTYEDMYTSASGCDSLVITELLILDTDISSNDVEICAGSSYSEGTSVYSVTGTYEDVYQDIDGCDSLVVTNLTVLPEIEQTNNVEICVGSTFTEGTATYETAGTYTESYQTDEGCDSLVITILVISDFVTNTVLATICEGQAYNEGVDIYTESGVYNATYSTSTGCDSLVITNLTVLTIEYFTNVITICEGETYSEGPSNYSSEGTYTDIYQTALGCDSIVTTELTVLGISTSTNSVSICEGETYYEDASEYTTTGIYTDVYSSAQGCDSIIITNLTVYPLESSTNIVNVCAGDTYLEGSSSYTSTGIYTDVYTSINGCDSTVTTLLTVNQSVSTDLSMTVCEGETLPELGVYFDEPNNRFVDSLSTTSGCDSLVFTYLEYIDPQVLLPESISICEGQSFVASLAGIADDFIITWSTGSSEEDETFSEEGEYWVEVTSLNCSASDTIVIQVHEIPFIPETDLDICMGSTRTINLPEENGNVTWSDGTEGDEIIVSEPGIYTANVQNACGSFIYEYDLTLTDCSCTIYIPNAFTADSDNLNDVFYVAHDCDFVEYELFIFNRWGEVVFQSKDPDAFWQGDHQNGNHFVPLGVYNYLLKYSSKDIENRVAADKIYGSITIVR